MNARAMMIRAAVSLPMNSRPSASLGDAALILRGGYDQRGDLIRLATARVLGQPTAPVGRLLAVGVASIFAPARWCDVARGGSIGGRGAWGPWRRSAGRPVLGCRWSGEGRRARPGVIWWAVFPRVETARSRRGLKCRLGVRLSDDARLL